jgi:hypothetical protein
MSQELKDDEGKLRYDLVPVSAPRAIAKCFTHGLKKHKENSWRKLEIKRIIGSTFRHLEAWRDGEKIDEESGLLNLELLLTNVAMLLELDTTVSEDYIILCPTCGRVPETLRTIDGAWNVRCCQNHYVSSDLEDATRRWNKGVGR